MKAIVFILLMTVGLVILFDFSIKFRVRFGKKSLIVHKEFGKMIQFKIEKREQPQKPTTT